MNTTYKHVVLIGLDGAGNFIQYTDTPNLDRMFAEGAGTMYCRTAFPSISAECWGSMLIGVDPDVHGLTNDIVERGDKYTDLAHPSIFRLIREAHPDAVIGAYSNWDPINTGMIEEGTNVDLATGDDPELAPMICDYIKEKKPEFLFIQLDNPDHFGHHYGYRSKEQLDCITREDGYIGDIIAALKEAGIYEDTLVISTADHGGIGTGHGGDTEEEMNVYFTAVGKTVKKGAKPEMRIRDIPAIVAYALGVPASESWQGSLPEGLFE
ncbi:MAG: alkaline phosphatase family protein [Clostridia bacterium]|nr:alkaline phosphatase family protein [Clostridia bacterium]